MTEDEAIQKSGHTLGQLKEMVCVSCSETAFDIFIKGACPNNCDLETEAGMLKNTDIEDLI